MVVDGQVSLLQVYGHKPRVEEVTSQPSLGTQSTHSSWNFSQNQGSVPDTELTTMNKQRNRGNACMMLVCVMFVIKL